MHILIIPELKNIEVATPQFLEGLICLLWLFNFIN